MNKSVQNSTKKLSRNSGTISINMENSAMIPALFLLI